MFFLAIYDNLKVDWKLQNVTEAIYFFNYGISQWLLLVLFISYNE